MADLSDDDLDRLWRAPMSADWEHREFARAVIAEDRALNAPQAAPVAPAEPMTACPHDVPHRWPCAECDSAAPHPATASKE